MRISFWRVVAIAAITTGLYIGHGLHSGGGRSGTDSIFASTAFAGGVAAMREDNQYFVTASNDGRTVYVWQLNGARAPGYEAKAVAER